MGTSIAFGRIDVMDTVTLLPPHANTLIQGVADVIPDMVQNADALDAAFAFPVADIAALRAMGCLAAPLPGNLGGLGFGTEPAGSSAIGTLLRLLGKGNLSVARAFEAHVNALRLICLYGTDKQRGRAAEAAHAGHLFALWVTDGLDPVRIEAGMATKLCGAKVFCSAAGYATQAVITARRGDETLLLHVALRCPRPKPGSTVAPLGMRAAATGGMDFDGILVSEDDIIGKPGDYLREPEFSAGAWRTCAGLLGGLDALTGEVKAQLIARKRDGHPHQRARLGQIVIAQETASLWVNRAASVVEDPSMAAGDRQSYANLTRMAVERACLEALQLAHRSLGLAAFVPPNPVERLSRDLSTYLRQPAPDEALEDAAIWFLRHDVPSHRNSP
jgi:alkylation response protein AidB-like acyl-CoA dehydrogenase